jgi:hypothetical protein
LLKLEQRAPSNRSYGFAPRKLLLVHELDFDFLHEFSGRFLAQNNVID